ncbi:phospholipid scramblase [Schizosaccharomyces cryophilus OY26]|uniref:Phospholipid scramblase n=1 Tax=Schizosaccharomyces cryophilus (strain OY26 / ATCC MYA-4695 / CBS 11777 / NBRC 106824 / NRRL Y48691) TaxID=653667 RepID=S9VNZ7_SCHCR|nr:phospholipid scramblase [Schizosaccharomyces cryophilus OY26]EPY49708.1 phospholipid scramblase [Schizosaccharomyces cryophilus OY26]
MLNLTLSNSLLSHSFLRHCIPPAAAGLRSLKCRFYHKSPALRYIDASAQVVSRGPAAVSSTGVINHNSPAAPLLSQDVLIVERQLEMMNVFLGYEQANRYVILNHQGQHLGYIAEKGHTSFLSSMSRQLFRTHRPFVADVMDVHGNPILQLQRPFSWINSHLNVSAFNYSSDQPSLVGEIIQKWHPWRRKYQLFLAQSDMLDQFASVDERVLSWDFLLRNADNQILGSVTRNFMGLPREFFTDTGNYVLRFTSKDANLGTVENNQLLQAAEGDTSQVCPREMSLEERAVMLGSAVTIDFDYFSRTNSPTAGLTFPIMFGSSSPENDYQSEDLSAQEILKDEQNPRHSSIENSMPEQKSPFLSDADLDHPGDFWDVFDKDAEDRW